MVVYPKKRNLILLAAGMIIGAFFILAGRRVMEITSTDDFCFSCHIHPHATTSWKGSTHYDNQRGIVVHCVECHLPPKGRHHLWEKAMTGLRDVYGAWFKDTSDMNWELKSMPEYAVKHTYEESCIGCHQNLFTKGMSELGENAHIYYTENPGDLACINCHLNVGHYNSSAIHAANVAFGLQESAAGVIYGEAARVDSFADFTDRIPGTGVTFDMVAIPGGTFLMGSPAGEPVRDSDEGPVTEVTLSPFFMGRLEVTWDEYMAFFSQTAARGRSTDVPSAGSEMINSGAVDAFTGPTPPWGDPSQGWGQGMMPAITMTHHAATTYCRWLSQVTGKTYRLPTEAEWEYACRGGTNTAWFFDGDQPPDKRTVRRRLSGKDTTLINRYAIYRENSKGTPRFHPTIKPNPFNLLNMAGNVAEFCSDYYSSEAYAGYSGTVKDPRGPATGSEHVIRGGSFRDGAGALRSAARDYSLTDAWLKTDPQIPKSIWWYSDCRHVGFRVVCEFDEKTGKR